MDNCNCVVFNWNVRGLTNPARRKVVRDMTLQNRASIVCIQESKLAFVDRAIIAETLGTTFCENFCFLPVGGTRGGIILSCLSGILLLGFLSPDKQANLKMRATGLQWTITAVYGLQTDNEKTMFINELKDLKQVVLPNWIMVCDFNLIYKANDKSNPNINRDF